MRIPRFVKEYASYVTKQYENTDKVSETAYCTIINEIVKHCEMGFITPTDAIKSISNYAL